MQANVRRRIAVITIMALVIAAVVYGFMPRPVPVDVAKAVRDPFRVTIEEEGKTRVEDRFVLSAPVSGYMRRVELDVGDRVKERQAVVVLEPMRSDVLDPRRRAEAEAAVSAAKAVLSSAEENALAAAADADYARLRLERNRKLFEQGYIARDIFDQAESEAKRTGANRLSAEAAVKTARSDLERAKAVLRYSAATGTGGNIETVTVRTPVSGRILKKHHESEGVVNAGEPLIDIGDPSLLEVETEVLSADAVNIGPGTKVIFERWGGGDPLNGTVKIVEPAAFTKISSLGVEEQRVLVISDITSPPESWQRLGDRYRVEASFIIWEGKDVLQIPASALFRKGEEWAAFVMKNGKARLRELEVGHRNGLTAEILAGISEGETVIIHPDDSISDGVRVKVR
ncbi:MAG: HlyD family efflux transporter periplasmic adaptor subunit [Nitrospirota bacterium]|nr:HlyD family efflux transporter periplasmic adaptor subunit [Nitrospirota bacterium]